jgi:hypothetical protein
MVESGGSRLLESELDDMRSLVRLTVEFSHYLQGEDVASLVEDKLRYVCDSVFSGVDSFTLMSAAYRTLPSSLPSTLASSERSIDSVKEEFAFKYSEFSEETDFEKRFRLLLDLFKLQIVFAGLSY